MRVLTMTECQSLYGGGFTLVENYFFDDVAIYFAMIGLLASYDIGVVARSRYNNPNNPPIPLKEVAQCTLKTGLQGLVLGIGLDVVCKASSWAIKSLMG